MLVALRRHTASHLIRNIRGDEIVVIFCFALIYIDMMEIYNGKFPSLAYL